MTSMRLTHPDLDFWVDVTVYARDGRYMATADLAEDSRDIGVGDTPQAAVRAALEALGEPYATEMAVSEHSRRTGRPTLDPLTPASMMTMS